MKIVVTGGAGFIGSHLCARLLEDGHSVLCVDNLLTGSEQNIDSMRANPHFTFLQHDVTQPFNFAAEAIFHLASPASPVGYMEHPIETILVNSQGTYQMLEQARKQKALLLFSSTSEAYGDPLVHPQREDYWGNVNPIGPRACYDESKRLGETLTMEYYRQFQLNARIVRIFNTYGPNCWHYLSLIPPVRCLTWGIRKSIQCLSSPRPLSGCARLHQRSFLNPAVSMIQNVGDQILVKRSRC